MSISDDNLDDDNVGVVADNLGVVADNLGVDDDNLDDDNLGVAADNLGVATHNNFPSDSDDTPEDKRKPEERDLKKKQEFERCESCRFVRVHQKDDYALLQNDTLKHDAREVDTTRDCKDSCRTSSSGSGSASPAQGFDTYMNVGRDKVYDSSLLACTPNYVAKTALNAVGIPFFAACYAASKVGTAFPMINSGGLQDSTAIHMGHKALLYSNGILPSRIEDADCKSDFRDAPIIVSNHLSYLDGLVLSGELNMPRILAKRELAEMPVLGQVLIDLDTVFIERSDADSRQTVLKLIADHVDVWRSGDRPLLIFPEGTTSNGNAVLPFRKGAFVAGKPVRPVALFYDGTWNPSNPELRLDGDQVTSYDDKEWALQFFGHFFHSLTIKILPIYHPSDDEKNDPSLYANNVRDIVLTEYLALKDQFIRDRIENSWKAAAGRNSGRLGYEFGDETRAALKTMYNWLGWNSPNAETPVEEGSVPNQ